MSVKKHRGVNVDFWTDEKVVALSPLARLLFLGSWHYCCDSGHLDASPLELKLKVLPADNCDPEELVAEILAQGLFVQVDGLLSVPKLPEHQKIDKRYAIRCERCEDNGSSPEPPASPPRGPRVVPEGTRAEGDGEGDGEGEGVGGAGGPAPTPRKRGSRLPDIFQITDDMRAWAAEKVPGVDIDREHEVFCDYWRGVSGAKGVKTDWVATWRNWMRRTKPTAVDPDLPDWMQA